VQPEGVTDEGSAKWEASRRRRGEGDVFSPEFPSAGVKGSSGEKTSRKRGFGIDFSHGFIVDTVHLPRRLVRR
jgi:hypothetical protein